MEEKNKGKAYLGGGGESVRLCKHLPLPDCPTLRKGAEATKWGGARKERRSVSNFIMIFKVRLNWTRQHQFIVDFPCQSLLTWDARDYDVK